MGERFPPGRWWAYDGNWYPAAQRPAMPTWIAVDGAERRACGRQESAGVRWWEPEAGVLCRACTVREGVGSPPPGPASDAPTGDQSAETVPPPDKGASVAVPRWTHQTIARLRLQRDGECCDCGVAVPADRWAGWDRATKVVVCEDCLDRSSVGLVGSPGSSAAKESEGSAHRCSTWSTSPDADPGDLASPSRFDPGDEREHQSAELQHPVSSS